MACASCGAHIRQLARQYQYMDAKPVVEQITPRDMGKIKAALHAKNDYETSVEELDSEEVIKVEDLSIIHTR